MILEPTKEKKKRRKGAKHLISFDDEEGILSSSIPSSCGSTLSDNSNESSSSTKSGDLNVKQENLAEPNITNSSTEHNERKPLRKLSIETSGSRDKYPNKIEGTLTPVQSNIGELTPVSVETTDEMSASTDNVEIPSDISAVLSVVEAKNNEELRKLNEKISNLTKENETLRTQLKKYIGALQLLNKDDDKLQKVLEDLEVDPKSFDYQHEAKIFEKKLVQVAEMHAELMDFNVTLQQNICSKDTLIDRLRSELEALRGPVNEELNENLRPCINVWIPSAFLTGKSSIFT